jgi:hypothetical protein
MPSTRDDTPSTSTTPHTAPTSLLTPPQQHISPAQIQICKIYMFGEKIKHFLCSEVASSHMRKLLIPNFNINETQQQMNL